MKKSIIKYGSFITISVITTLLSGFLSCAIANETISNKSNGMNLASSCSSGTCSGRTERPRDDREE